MSAVTQEAKDEIVRAILTNIFKTLQRQDFADWYNEGGRFDSFITGCDMEKTFGTENRAVVETLIKQDILHLFNIV